jgi:hypothetical protein
MVFFVLHLAFSFIRKSDQKETFAQIFRKNLVCRDPFQPDKLATSFFLLAREERSKKGGPFLFNSLDFRLFNFIFGKVPFHCSYVIAYKRLQTDR